MIQQAALFPDLEAPVARVAPPVAPPIPPVRRKRDPVVPPATRERHLAIRVGTDVSLVGVETVRAIRGGLDAESVAALIDCGEIRWVFDVARPGRRRRELRFLAEEIVKGRRPGTEEEAIRCAMGSTERRARFRGAQVEQMWLISAQTVLRLCAAGELAAVMEGRVRWISRESLVAFLRRRLVRD